MYDIIIVGAGVLGLSTAIKLNKRDPSLNIAVVGPSLAEKNGATEAAGAMLGCFGEVTTNLINSDYGLAKLGMSIEAKNDWESWLEYLNDVSRESEPLRIKYGTTIILNAKSGSYDKGNFTAMKRMLEKNNEPYENIDSKSISGYEPSGDCTNLGAIYLPKEGSIDPLMLIEKLMDAVNVLPGITYYNHCVTEVISKNDCVTGVVINNLDSIYASEVIIASGAYSQKLLAPLKLNSIPMVLSGVGCALLLKMPTVKIEGVIRTPNRSGGCGLHALTRNSGDIYIGASSHFEVIPGVFPKIRESYYLQQAAVEQMNTRFCDAHIVKSILGNRPVSIDTFPLIGRANKRGLSILTGTFRDGLHQSPVLADLIVNDLLENKPPLLNKFSPTRRPIEAMSKKESILSALSQAMSADYEHGIKFPFTGWHHEYKEILLKKLKHTDEQLETDISIPPEILLMLARKGDESIGLFRDYYKDLSKESVESC